jgi:N-acetylated-alpha-linked acidic dipeptidase
MIADGTLLAAADPKETYVVPAQKPPVPYLNFAPLENANARLRASVQALSAAAKAPIAPARRVELDRIYAGVERSLTRTEGLPGRPWYRHFVYAPGQYTGYGVKTFPGVREAIELRRWDEAQQQIGVLADVLNACASELDRATVLIAAK